MRLGARPTIYEINTAVWLSHLGVHTLAQVPARAWDGLAALPVDAVWLMGVWERSPAGLEIALRDPVLAESFRVALPDLRAGDVIGSPYCIRRYEVDERFGGRAALAHAREELAARGLGLVLDYVPNHVAPDHPWVSEHPEFFLRDEDGRIALGRDPYFPPWPDVVQLNAFDPGCGRPSPTCSSTSAPSATACAATWRCCSPTRSSPARGGSSRPRRSSGRR